MFNAIQFKNSSHPRNQKFSGCCFPSKIKNLGFFKHPKAFVEVSTSIFNKKKKNLKKKFEKKKKNRGKFLILNF